MENMMAQHSDIKVVFCENDAMCLGALQAAQTAGRADDIIFAGVDGQNEAIAEILKGGPYKITGYNDANIIGQKGFDVLIEIIKGQSVPPKLNKIDSPAITIENAEEYKNAGIY
jgi:ribose transport system substrate-binding protein